MALARLSDCRGAAHRSQCGDALYGAERASYNIGNPTRFEFVLISSGTSARPFLPSPRWPSLPLIGSDTLAADAHPRGENLQFDVLGPAMTLAQTRPPAHSLISIF